MLKMSDTPSPMPTDAMRGQPDSELSSQQQVEFEAAAFRRLIQHLRDRTDVQNIDLMNMAGFCRNCLSNWYLDAANAAGARLTKDQSREMVYGMPYEDWKKLNQPEATGAQKAAFTDNKPAHG
jgi:hypothetical protein